MSPNAIPQGSDSHLYGEHQIIQQEGAGFKPVIPLLRGQEVKWMMGSGGPSVVKGMFCLPETSLDPPVKNLEVWRPDLQVWVCVKSADFSWMFRPHWPMWRARLMLRGHMLGKFRSLNWICLQRKTVNKGLWEWLLFCCVFFVCFWLFFVSCCLVSFSVGLWLLWTIYRSLASSFVPPHRLGYVHAQFVNSLVLCNMQPNVLNDLARAKRHWTEKKGLWECQRRPSKSQFCLWVRPACAKILTSVTAKNSAAAPPLRWSSLLDQHLKPGDRCWRAAANSRRVSMGNWEWIIPTRFISSPDKNLGLWKELQLDQGFMRTEAWQK